jgi:thioredoxin reductase (NADPH)
MSIIPVPDELTHYSSRRLDEVDDAWPVLSQHALDLLRSSGEE